MQKHEREIIKAVQNLHPLVEVEYIESGNHPRLRAKCSGKMVTINVSRSSSNSGNEARMAAANVRRAFMAEGLDVAKLPPPDKPKVAPVAEPVAPRGRHTVVPHNPVLTEAMQRMLGRLPPAPPPAEAQGPAPVVAAPPPPAPVPPPPPPPPPPAPVPSPRAEVAAFVKSLVDDEGAPPVATGFAQALAKPPVEPAPPSTTITPPTPAPAPEPSTPPAQAAPAPSKRGDNVKNMDPAKRKALLEKMWAARRKQAAEEKAKKLAKAERALKRAGKAVVPKESLNDKRPAAGLPPKPVATPAPAALSKSDEELMAMIETLPLKQARMVFDKLKELFK